MNNSFTIPGMTESPFFTDSDSDSESSQFLYQLQASLAAGSKESTVSKAAAKSLISLANCGLKSHFT